MRSNTLKARTYTETHNITKHGKTQAQIYAPNGIRKPWHSVRATSLLTQTVKGKVVPVLNYLRTMP
jgi:hypothetical protein